MSNYTQLVINKNRGWRGLAEARIIDPETKDEIRMIFSFSQDVWTDLVFRHKLAMQDNEYLYVVEFEDKDHKLPRPEQQRSVLIKDFHTTITHIYKTPKHTMSDEIKPEDRWVLYHFDKNRNNHTKSDWNCIGIRVMPEI